MTTPKPAAPKRGDIIWIDLNPQKGHEQAGRRPVLVLSNDRFNSLTHLVICCPITQQVKDYPTEVPLPESLSTKGVVLTNQVRTLDWQARGFSVTEQTPEKLVEQVLELLLTVLSA